MHRSRSDYMGKKGKNTLHMIGLHCEEPGLAALPHVQ